MKLIRSLAILVLLFLSTTVLSAVAAPLPAGMTTVPLATITNDRDSSVSHIKLMLNDQAVVKGIYMTTSPSASSSASPKQSQVYWLTGIESDRGVVLGQGQGVQAIFLRGNIEPEYGYGALTISYLSNGLFRNYNQCQLGLQRVNPHDWQLVNSYNNQPITHIEVQTWALGISTLKNVCPTA